MLNSHYLNIDKIKQIEIYDNILEKLEKQLFELSSLKNDKIESNIYFQYEHIESMENLYIDYINHKK